MNLNGQRNSLAIGTRLGLGQGTFTLLPVAPYGSPHCYSQPVSLALTRVLCHNCRLLSLKRCLWIRAIKLQGTQWHALLLRRRLKSGSYLLSSRPRLQKLSHRLSTHTQAIPCVASFIQKLSLRYMLATFRGGYLPSGQNVLAARVRMRCTRWRSPTHVIYPWMVTYSIHS